MDQFTHKTLVTKPFDLTYSYYTSPSFSSRDPSIPVVLLTHGYPDDAHMWAGTLPTLLQNPYPIILIEILGLGHSSKSTTTDHYRDKQQADSIAQILDAEGVENNVIPIGHDWGSNISQRVYLWHRERCIGLGMFSLAYQPPHSDPMDLDAANKATTKTLGYPQWEYWNFFTAPDAPKLMEDRIDRFYAVNNGYYPSPDPKENGQDIWMREMFCVPGGMRDYVQGTGKWKDYTVELREYAKNPELQKRFAERLRKSGMSAPVQYYHALKDNWNLEDERQLAGKGEIKVPVLYIGMYYDWVCRTDLNEQPIKQGLIKDFERKVLDACHWSLYDDEIAKQAAGFVSDWLTRRFPVKK